MLSFFIIFVVIGFACGLYYYQNKNIVAIIIGLTPIIWFFIYGFWAIATFIELILGLLIGLKFSGKQNSNNDE